MNELWQNYLRASNINDLELLSHVKGFAGYPLWRLT